MKKTVKILALFLSACTLLSACAVGDKGGNGGRTVPEVEEKIYDKDLGTVHVYTVRGSDELLVSNGKTDYAVVYPASAENNTDMITAVSELRHFFKEATGITLKAYSDAEHVSDDKIISIGKTVQFTESAAALSFYGEYDLKRNGFIIKTDGNSVYICGAETLANLYGVYEFLYREFGYKYYFQDCYDLEKNVREKVLLDLAIADVPDIQFRCNGNGEEMISAANRYRLRYNTTVDFYTNASGLAATHNYFYYVPKGTYLNDHPEWYSTDGSQLCFTRDPEGLSDVVFEKMKEVFLGDPDHDYIPFMLNDGGYWCGCSSCIAHKDDYENETMNYCATQIEFINGLADRLKIWNEEVCPERKLVICIMSYGRLQVPPVKENADGTFSVLDEKYTLRDNVAIQLTFGGYVYNLYHDGNQANLKRVKQWGAVTSNIYYWIYSASFADYLMPFDVLDSRKQYIGFFIDIGCLMMFDNGRWDTAYSSDFNALRSYVTSRLEWNCQLRLDDLIKEFCDGYFGEASSVMQEMVEEYRGYAAYLYNVRKVPFYVQGATSERTTDNWPYRKVQEFLGYIDRAYSAIEPIKNTDPERYNVLYKNVLRESISYRYLVLKLYANTFDLELLNEEKKKFIDDCNETGISMSAEYMAIGNLFG